VPRERHPGGGAAARYETELSQLRPPGFRRLRVHKDFEHDLPPRILVLSVRYGVVSGKPETFLI
jgi:hypothetical protein